MLVAKGFADLVTLARAVLGLGLAWLGLSYGAAGLTRAVSFLIAAWTSDALDGPIARRSPKASQTWIGDHDLEVDMAVACGLLVYLLGAGFVNAWLACGYLAFWALIFLRFGVQRSPGMLCQAPVYAWFIWVALQQVPQAGVWLLVWILVAVVVTWPRFPRQVVPGFLAGMGLRKRAG